MSEMSKQWEGSFTNPTLFHPMQYSVIGQEDKIANECKTVSVNEGVLVTTGGRNVISNPCNLPTWTWLPDGHLSVLRNAGNDNKFAIYWSEWENYRTVADTPWPEDHKAPNPGINIWGGRTGALGAFNSGGMWLQSVVRRGTPGNPARTWRVMGTYHAEDRYSMDKDECWKSIGVCYSKEDGRFGWYDGGRIITQGMAKPATPCFGGVGDHCYVWDWINKRHVIYFTDSMGIHMAISFDILARPGTWYKWHDGAFNENGLGGKSTRIEALAGLDEWKGTAAGCNPSCAWSHYLKKWVMVWTTWTGRICFSTCGADMINWDKPRVIADSQEGGKVWYATLIDPEYGDQSIGEAPRLYYADFAPDNTRKFCWVQVNLKKVPKNAPQLAQPSKGIISKTLNPAWVAQQGQKQAAAQAAKIQKEAEALKATDPALAAQKTAAATALTTNAAAVAANDTTAVAAPAGATQ